MTRAAALGAALLLALPLTVRAEEPRGCGAFKWPIERERAALGGAAPPLGDPSAMRAAAATPFALALERGGEARLPKPPERPAREPDTYSGFAQFAAPAASGPFQVVLSAAAWVDVVQGDAYLKPTAFGGALDCPGVRKVVRYDVGPAPFTLQVSAAASDRIGVIVEPVTEGTR